MKDESGRGKAGGGKQRAEGGMRMHNAECIMM